VTTALADPTGSADEPRFGPAIGFAPFAAPVAVFIVLLLRSAFGWGTAAVPSGQGPGSYSLAAFVSWLFIIIVFGAPPSYVATLLFVWPSSRALAALGWFRWYTVTSASAVAGGVLMPLYLHLLEPEGGVKLFPGAGAVAGAAIGIAFWFIATRWPRAQGGT
jgi:hypothetical protein